MQAFDPEAMEEAQRIYGHREDLKLVGTKEAAIVGADALAICTEWQFFRAPDFTHLEATLAHKVVFDGRNLFEPGFVADYGLAYYGTGRGLSIKGRH